MSDTYDLHASLGYQMSVTARLLERGFETRLKEIGLTRITWCILLAAGPQRLSQPSDIADFVGIDRTATSRALRQMETAGLIARIGGDKDKRTTFVGLTPDAEHKLEQASQHAQQNAGYFEDKLTKDESNMLRALLVKLRADEDDPLQRL